LSTQSQCPHRGNRWGKGKEDTGTGKPLFIPHIDIDVNLLSSNWVQKARKSSGSAWNRTNLEDHPCWIHSAVVNFAELKARERR
jgi:hypothetical protein